MADHQEPSLTVEIRRTGEDEGVRIVTAGGAVAELARFLVEDYCRALSFGVPPTHAVHPPDNELAEGSYKVEAFCVSGWVPVSERLPEIDAVVWLWELGRGAWIGARVDAAEGWLWANCYGSEWWAGKRGSWRSFDNATDDDYQPTHWHPLPAAPPSPAGEPATKEGELLAAPEEGRDG